MWNVHGEGQVENFKRFENYAKLTSQKLFEVIFCEYGQGLGKKNS
jgi:hypothetical protein